MNLKFSSIFCLTFMCLVLMHPANSFEIKSFFDKIKHFFSFLSPKKEIEKGIEIEKNINDCVGLDLNKTFASTLDEFKSKIGLRYPGTKWCGKGSTADNPDDVGTFSKSDKCCRDHDMCPEDISAGQSKYGLRNNGLYTRSHCKCDKKLYDCLKEVKTLVADSLGYTYFTILGPQCFRKDYPAAGCAQYQNGRCVKYNYNRNGKKQYQWFDNPTF